MKKLGLIAMALALVVGLTQCKKEETNSNTETNGVRITLSVDNGSKVVVNPTGHTSPDYATVSFESGDIIYVGNNGAYCGYLEYDGSKFAGTITPTGADDADYLHFYFMGNKGTTSEPMSVNITDQTSKYPVISYGPSNEKYSAGTTSYKATLKNKCAIVKFTTTDIDADITVSGMKNTVTVDFAANNGATTGEPYSFSKSGDGDITLHRVSNTERWAILLPQDEVTTATATATGYATESAFTVPAITANMYDNSGISVELSATSSVPVGAISGKFTINASGDQVYFSQGNLQYIGSAATPYWKFAENQWDYFGTTTGQNSADTDKDRDLFGWGTSGYHDSNDQYNTNYHPYSTSNSIVNTTYNKYGYGPSTNMADPNLVGTSANYDWGVYNAISNGGNAANIWRTLTEDEWGYVFSTRTNAADLFGEGSVNGVNGCILLPDDWTLPDGLTFTAGASAWSNSYTVDQWEQMESAGAVFLPAAGYLYETALKNLGKYGYYWSSTSLSNSTNARRMAFYNKKVQNTGNGGRSSGFSVRLVCPAE